MNEPGIVDSATQAAEWLFDRREHLEKHQDEPLTLLWLSVSEIDPISDSFDALEAAHGLTADELRVTRRSHRLDRRKRCREERMTPRGPTAGRRRCAAPSRAGNAADAACRTFGTRTSATRATTSSTELYAGWPR